MNEIIRETNRARRRLTTVLFMQSLVQAWLITFAIAIVLLIIPKLWPLPFDGERAAIGCLMAAAGMGLFWAIIQTILRRPSQIEAATELDRRLKLRERISSSLQMSDQELASPLGQALVSDAERAASRIDIRDTFPLGLDRPYYWGLLPILLSAATFLIPNATSTRPVANSLSAETLTHIKNSTNNLMELIRQQREQAEEEGLDESADFFKQLENKIDDLRKSDMKDPKRILSEINQLKETLQKRRDELGSAESLKKNLAGLQSLDKGPAEKMTDAMKDGDFDEASQELEKMMEDLEMGKLSGDQQKQLAKQMDQMAAALEQAAVEHEQAKDALKKQIADAEKTGDIQKVAELREKLAEKQSQDAGIEELAQMASDMKAAKEALEQGDQAAAKQALEKMNSKLEKMDGDNKQLQELDKLMNGADACKKCAGGQMAEAGKMGADGLAGNGIGNGIGEIEQPDKETEIRHIDSQVRLDVQTGETIYGGKAGGANRKGVTHEEIQKSVLATNVEDAYALENISIPKKQREHTREYFDSLRAK